MHGERSASSGIRRRIAATPRSPRSPDRGDSLRRRRIADAEPAPCERRHQSEFFDRPVDDGSRYQTTIPTVAGDIGSLQEFAPVSASTWWTVLQGGTTSSPRTWVIRTTDSGAQLAQRLADPGRRRDRLLPRCRRRLDRGRCTVAGPASDDQTALPHARRRPSLESDSAAVARRLSELQFVDQLHGWCTVLGGALGSEFVEIWRRPTAAERGSLYRGTRSLRQAVQLRPRTRCRSAATSRSPSRRRRSGGHRSRATAALPRSTRAPMPAPPGTPFPACRFRRTGSDRRRLRIRRARRAADHEIALTAQCSRPARRDRRGRSDDGGATWRTAPIPDPTKQWDIDLVDPTHWRMTDGTDLMATDDAGAHWRTMTPPPTTTDPLGAPLDLEFLTPHAGLGDPRTERRADLVDPRRRPELAAGFDRGGSVPARRARYDDGAWPTPIIPSPMTTS